MRENANEESFTRYGKKFSQPEQVKQNQVLFTKGYYEKVGASEFAEGNVAVYNEFSRKLYNTRINEFEDTFRQKAAAGKGKATLSGQNLTDTLLTQHIKDQNLISSHYYAQLHFLLYFSSALVFHV